MKKLLLSLVLLTATFTAKSQIVLFQDSFETYTNFAIANVGSWTLTDVDLRPTYVFDTSAAVSPNFTNAGAPMPFIVFNSTLVQPTLTPSASSNWTARSGQKAMACIASVPNAAQPRNNDWLISPQIALGTSGNTLTFWAKSCDATFGAERFTVNVSTTNTTPASFTKISAGTFTATVFGPYVQYTYNLDAYQGQNVFIGVRCVSEDQFGFMLDDFRVTATTVSSVQALALQKLKVYPNPAKNVLNIDNGGVEITNVSITDLNGRIVKNETSNVSKISISDLSQGMYLLTINTVNGKKTEKLIIE